MFSSLSTWSDINQDRAEKESDEVNLSTNMICIPMRVFFFPSEYWWWSPYDLFGNVDGYRWEIIGYLHPTSLIDMDCKLQTSENVVFTECCVLPENKTMFWGLKGRNIKSGMIYVRNVKMKSFFHQRNIGRGNKELVTRKVWNPSGSNSFCFIFMLIFWSGFKFSCVNWILLQGFTKFEVFHGIYKPRLESISLDIKYQFSSYSVLLRVEKSLSTAK